MTTHPERLLARAADGAALTGEAQRELDLHLGTCAECREALDAQRLVARTLHARTDAAVPPGFARHLSARLDGTGGMLDLANWRAWTVGLVPVAAALVAIAYLGVGTWDSGVATLSNSESRVASADTVTFENWASASSGATPAAVFLQPSASGDQLLETVLTGSVPSTMGEPANVR